MDSAGEWVTFTLIPGNAAEHLELAALLDGVPTGETSEIVADKAYDVDALRALLASLGIIFHCPPKSNRRHPAEYDEESYRGRHIVENSFVDVKQFRGIATRYCKYAETFCAALHLAAWCRRTRGRGRKESKYLIRD